VLSRDVTADRFGRRDLREVPVAVDWFGKRKGVRWSRAELAGRLRDGVLGGGPVGVMLHHELVDDLERADIDDVLRLVASHPAAGSTALLDHAD
jgi:hypothetical protein